MARHRAETRHLRTGVAGLAVVLGLWCTGDSTVTVSPATAQRPVTGQPVPLAAPAPPEVRTPSTAAPSGPTVSTAAPSGPTVSTAAPSGPTPAPASAPRTPAPTAGPGTGPGVLPASAPVQLTVGRIGLEDRLMTLGRRPDRTLEVPPERPGSPAGWYRDSPTPGEAGPAVLLGHVNATGGGPGVFADLHRLVPGDRIAVARADGSTAVFAVDAVERYAKDAFPTLRVYGNTAGPELRLITCDGYDPATGWFAENLVVHASLVRS
ncbi:class F sortase [Kocuria sp. CPCC 205300]|uniref:class F sortase n=1 Tax=Kocuria sabuli TaxID=3071448 RepID=UPI0036DADDA1